ncbi:alpha-1-inhibitor 3-like isoform X2 [Trachemys scripta elegans]|uniref:alpha-1-inhibitor 3-like isoform X2 n=1 Tax=Trachemys scripta elegans TaxID=31138 RepID=UPI001551C42B|nr:alpha-1-inhibitor 3-like isoform X2 [Trachemys scripta elegans]
MQQSDPVLQKALKCLKELVSADPGSSSLYSQALAAIAFALAGDEVMRKEIVNRLDQSAILADGHMYWTQQPKPKEGSMYWYRAPSVDVELTSSNLMVHLLKPNLSSADIRRASQIVSWLTKQQKSYGGFASTQGTVVALEALALYGLKTYSKDGPDLHASISSEGFSHEIQVNDTNQLLLQTVQLPAIPSSYTVQAQGHRCLFLQTTLRYNIPPPRSDLTFAPSVRTECIGLKAIRFPITVHSQHFL